MTLEFVDTLFRFSAIANLVWVIVFAALKPNEKHNTYFTIALAVGGICFLIVIAFDEVALFGWLGHVLYFLSRLTLIHTWFFCITVMKDNFRFGKLYQIIYGLYIVRALTFQFEVVPTDLLVTISISMRAILFSYLVYIVFSDLAGDLIEKRRKFRVWFMGSLIILPSLFTIERIFFSHSLYADNASILESTSLFLMSSLLLFHTVRPRLQHIFEPDDELAYRQTNSDTTRQEPANLTTADEHSLALLETEMQSGLYRNQGLTVADIANTINIPEHRLRKLINQHLGHRNISQFLNDYRVEEAKKRLADVDERHVSILVIAMEAGYISLRPFNRAFKNRTGQTPSEYREQNLKVTDNKT